MKRYAIVVRENYPGAQIRERCRVNSKPNAVNIAKRMQDTRHTVSVGGTTCSEFKYNHVEIVDLGYSTDDRCTNETPG